MAVNIKPSTPAGGVISPVRLYWAEDGQTILTEKEEGKARLLCPAGVRVPDRWALAVKTYLASQGGSVPSQPAQDDEPEDSPVEDRETRVVTGLKKRGRPKKVDADGAD